MRIISERWKRATRPLKIHKKKYGHRLVEMLKKYNGEKINRFDAPIFGFVSKYQKGANTPTGETEFQFKAGNLNFHSSSYDWLVVAGSKAMYKGVGTINGAGNYGFMLSAIDGTPGKFRIKIRDSNGIVYDNMMGGADNADPTTVIGGGSIVVHK